VNLSLSETQAAFVQDQHRYAAFVGGIGSGKTYAGAVKALVQELPRPGLGLVAAPTFGMLRDATWRTCLELWQPLIAGVYRQEMRIVLTTGAEAIFRSADDPEHLRGPNCAWAWVDEAAQCAAATWPITIGRLRQHGKAGRAWATTTPQGFNWVHDVFTAGGDDVALYRAATRSNPFIDEAFVASLESQYSREYARQELLGEFITLGAGLIRREWFTIADFAPPGLTWVRYWDLAASTKASADYTASIRAARDDQGGLWLADMVRGRWTWPDARRRILDTLATENADVGIEQAGFQLAAVQDILADPVTLARTVRGVSVDKDKLARAQPWIARAEAGAVRLVRGPWVSDFLAECEAFPQGGHDDQIDAVSGATAMLASVQPPMRLWRV
jgi:predicted phage terminase large subunit-like protein